MDTVKIDQEQIDGTIVNSINGIQVDNTDPKNPVLPEFALKSVYDIAIANKANVDGSNTNGGAWFIDSIFSNEFAGNKKVLEVLGGQMTIEYGNVDLLKHRFVVNNKDNLIIKVGADEGYILNTLNFDAAQFDTAIPDWSTDLEQKTNF